MVIEHAVEIRRSPDEVFDYCTDLRREPEWNPRTRRIEKLTDGPIGLGTRYLGEWIRGDPMTIEFVGSAESYASRVANPAMAASDGTYSSADRTIRVRLQPDIESNFLILRHEITHALLHERVGHLSTPVNEGLAGYFERVEVSGLGAQVSLDESRLSIGDAAVSTDGSAELVDLLARDGVLFYAEGREQRYVHAFAMVALLMGTPDGRQALIDLLAAQRAQPCVPVDAALVFDASYPGGLLALAADWSRWLRDPPRSVQSF